MPLFRYSITLKLSFNEILRVMPNKTIKKKCMELDFREVKFQNAAIGLKNVTIGLKNVTIGHPEYQTHLKKFLQENATIGF